MVFNSFEIKIRRSAQGVLKKENKFKKKEKLLPLPRNQNKSVTSVSALAGY